MKNRAAIGLGALAGAAGGFAYFHYFGCANGCPLKSNPYLMTGYGALVGALVLETLVDIVGRLRRARLAREEPPPV